jgi:cyclic-di-GMP-binding protein
VSRNPGKTYKVTGTLKQGVDGEKRQEDHRARPRRGPQGRQDPDPGRQLRVTSKKRDDLQAVIAMLKKADLDVALQFVNYR